MNPKKLFFIYPKFLQNGFFSTGRRLVHPAAGLRFRLQHGSSVFRDDSAARLQLWPQPGSPVFRDDSAARLRLWHRPGSSVFRADSGHRFRFRLRPGSQVFKTDSGRRFRHERGLIFSLQKPRQKWRKTATISVGKLARYIYIPLPICQFMDVAVFLPKTMLFRAFWPFFCYNHSDLIFSPKTAVFLPANHRFSTLKYDHFLP